MLPPGHLIVAGPDPLGGDIVHLDAREPFPRGSLRTVRIGRSCHNAAEVHALSIEDYVTLSPIFPTDTKPGYGPALAPDGAAALKAPVPWVALGGIVSPDRVRQCAAAGAAGIAALGVIMRAGDPAQVASDLVEAWGAS
jgi:thiamine-phosphate pyrophosphorylase